MSHLLVRLSFNSQFLVGNIAKMPFALMSYIAIRQTRQTAQQNKCAIQNLNYRQNEWSFDDGGWSTVV